ALVELEDIGDLLEVVAVLLEVLLEVLQGFQVGVQAFFLGIGHEDHSIHAAQDQFAAGVVENLSGDGVKVKPGAQAADGTQIQGKEVEEQGAISLRGQRDHLALLLVGGLIKDELQVRGLTTQTSAVIYDFAVDFARRKIDKTQDSPRIRVARQKRPHGGFRTSMSPLLKDFLYHTKAGLKGLYMALRPSHLTTWLGRNYRGTRLSAAGQDAAPPVAAKAAPATGNIRPQAERTS